jgi:hypothetical protein
LNVWISEGGIGSVIEKTAALAHNMQRIIIRVWWGGAPNFRASALVPGSDRKRLEKHRFSATTREIVSAWQADSICGI